MSKAFLPDDAPVPEVLPAPRTEVLPVTPAGHVALAAALDAARKQGDQHGAQRLESVLATVEVRVPFLDERGGADFGCIVTLGNASTQRRYQLVGPDEVDASRGLISLVSPVGQRLRGARVGDSIELPQGAKSLEFEVLTVALP